MHKKTVVHNVAYQVAGRIVSSGLGFITTSLLAHHLGVLAFGAFNFVLTASYFAYLIADYGLQTLLIRAVAQGREEKKIFGNILVARILLGAFVSVCVLFGVWFLPYSDSVKYALLIVSAGQSMYLLTSLFWAVLQGRMMFGKMVLAQITISITQALLTYLGVKWNMGLPFFAVVYTSAMTVGLVMSWKTARTYIGTVVFNWDFNEFFSTLRMALPFALGLLVSVAYLRIDTLILAYYFNPSLSPDLGLYSIAYKPFEIITVFGGFIAQTLYPLFSRHIGHKEMYGDVKKYGLYTLLSAAAGALFLFIFASHIVRILGGNQYYDAVISLRILSAAAFVTIVSGFAVAIALAGGKEKQLMYYAAMALCVNIILNVLFVPQLSYIATSWTTVITQTLILLGNGYAAWLVLRAQKI